MKLAKSFFFSNQVTIYLFCFILIFFSFWRVATERESVEKNIYDYYVESIVQDGDLNVFNQLPQKEKWQSTITGNYPDVHSNGIISLWYPFFVLKKILYGANQEKIFLFRSISSVFFGISGLITLFFWLKKRFDIKNFTLFFFLFFSGTSFFWYLLFESGNADLSSFFIASLELILFYSLYENFHMRLFFLFAVLMGVGFSLKVDHVFYLILPAVLFLKMIIEKCSLKYFFINLALFVLGFLVCTVPVIYNDYLKYGYIGYGYKDVLNFNYYLLWQNLFYPTGFLTNNPVYIFSLIMFFVLIFNPERKMSNLVGAVPIVSVMVESFTYVHHESYGARHWLAYIPVLVLFYFKFLQYVETKFKRISTYTIPVIVLMIAINLYKCYSSYVGGDIFYYGNEMSSAIWADIKMRGFGLLTNFFLPIDQQIKTPTVLFIVFILSVILTCLIYLFKNNKINFIREIKVLIVYFSISYIFLTGINVINYYSNVINIFSDAEYKDVLIGNGPHINSFYENIGTIEKAMKYHAANNDAAKVEYLSSVRKNFLLKAQKEIVRDPLGVSHSWKNLQSSNYIIEEKLRRDEAVVY